MTSGSVLSRQKHCVFADHGSLPVSDLPLLILTPAAIHLHSRQSPPNQVLDSDDGKAVVRIFRREQVDGQKLFATTAGRAPDAKVFNRLVLVSSGIQGRVALQPGLIWRCVVCACMCACLCARAIARTCVRVCVFMHVCVCARVRVCNIHNRYLTRASKGGASKTRAPEVSSAGSATRSAKKTCGALWTFPMQPSSPPPSALIYSCISRPCPCRERASSEVGGKEGEGGEEGMNEERV